MITTIDKCRVSNRNIKEIWDLGNFYLSHFYDDQKKDYPSSKLRIGIGEGSNLIQLLESVERDAMYRNYWYLSGTNKTMTKQLKDIVEIVPNWINLKDDDIVLDIGCNDGTLLDLYSKDIKVKKYGIDPATNLSKLAKSKIQNYLCDYFTANNFLNFSNNAKAKVITSIAMFYDQEDPNKFTKDIYDCLADDGIWILQLSYTPLMIMQNAFDNIVHEHLEYYTLNSLEYILHNNGFKIVDAELNNTNGGSIRVVACKNKNQMDNVSLFNNEIGLVRRQSIIEFENNNFEDMEKSLLNLKKRVENLKNETLDLLHKLKKNGKKVIGYGASTKGNTLLQYYGINSSLIEFIAEKQKQKFGKYTPGSWIQIISEEKMRSLSPDYLFILPWHFTTEFLKREIDLLKNGTKFIVPLPNLKILE